MITINNIKEIEKYKVGERPIEDPIIKSLTYYEFKENGKLEDVEFNVNISLDNHVFIANNVNMKKGGGLYLIQAKSLAFSGECNIEDIQIEDNINGDKLTCGYVSANQITCDELETEDIICKNVKVNKLGLGRYHLENVDCMINAVD